MSLPFLGLDTCCSLQVNVLQKLAKPRDDFLIHRSDSEISDNAEKEKTERMLYSSRDLLLHMSALT